MFSNKHPERTYNVKLISKEHGINATIAVRGDEYILEAAQNQGVKLEYSCSAGYCTGCAAKLLEGEVDHDQVFLKQREIDAGFLLLCKSYPMSDCVIEVDQEEALLNL